MIDKILILNDTEAEIIYDHKPSVKIHAENRDKLLNLLAFLTTDKPKFVDTSEEITLITCVSEAA